MLKTETNGAIEGTSKADIDNEIKQLMEEKAEVKSFPKDEEFNPFSADDIIKVQTPDSQRNNEFGFEGTQTYGFPQVSGKKSKDNAELRQVDELLASVPQAQGYYLKLEKEIGVNEWQLKMRIDDYSFWADLPWEVTKIVRAQTLKDPLSYGTGKYRIIVWHQNGLRGDKRPPIFLNIDAQESMLTGNNKSSGQPETVEDKLEGMAKLVGTMQNFMPKPVDPQTQSSQLAEAFKQGQSLTAQKEANAENNMATMMTAMMTAQMQASRDMAAMQAKSSQDMMQMMMLMMQNKPADQNKDIMNLLLAKVLNDNSNKPDPSMRPITMMKEMREAGLIPKKEDTGIAEQLKTIVMLKDIAGEMFSSGDSKSEGGVLDKLFSSIGEKLPDIIGNVTGTINNVVALNKAKLAMAQGTRVAIQNPPKGIDGQVRSNPATQGQAPVDPGILGDGNTPAKEEDKMNFMVMMFANQLNKWVKDKNHDEGTFKQITDATLKMTEGKPLIQEALKNGTMQPEDLAKMIISDLDKLNYNTVDSAKALLEYCQAYANYIIGDDGKYVVECSVCGQQYNFDSAEEFLNMSAAEQQCGEDNCTGMLHPVQEPSNEANTDENSTEPVDNN